MSGRLTANLHAQGCHAWAMTNTAILLYFVVENPFFSSRRWSAFKVDASGVVFCLSAVHFTVCWAAGCPEWHPWSCVFLCRTDCFSSGISGKHWTFCSWAGWWRGLHWWTAAGVFLLSQCRDLKGPAQGRMWCSTGSDKNSFRLLFFFPILPGAWPSQPQPLHFAAWTLVASQCYSRPAHPPGKGKQHSSIRTGLPALFICSVLWKGFPVRHMLSFSQKIIVHSNCKY